MQIVNNHSVIVICDNNKPIAELREYKSNNIKNIKGLLVIKIKISENFD